MGGGQPYMYGAPTRYSAVDPYNGFNPKAITQAYNAPRSPQRPKPEGPLLNFNRHPDSYAAPPYGVLNFSPMHWNTKRRVGWARRIQLALRVLELLAAVGILICVIAIKGTTDNEGWIIRAPPSADIVACIYGIYHLARSGKARPPASSASYHFFALCIDAGLIPFYVFTAMLGRQNLDQDPQADGRWRTYFATAEATNKILFVTYLLTVINASFHLASTLLNMYLVIMFRKIANLPPDMNPLEDNLTSRRKSKHKHKSSSLSEVTNNRWSQATNSRLLDSRNNRRSEIRESIYDEKDNSRISFLQSRTGQDNSFSPHNPRTAHRSQMDASGQQTYLERYQTGEAGDWGDILPPGAVIDTPTKRLSAMPSLPTMTKRSSVSIAPANNDSEETLHQHSTHEDLKNDNWFVMSESPDLANQQIALPEDDEYDPFRAASPYKEPIKERTSKLYKTNNTYSAVPHQSLEDDEDELDYEQQPLKMHPPTPPHDPDMSDRHMQSQTTTYLSPSSHRIVSPLQEITGNRSHTMTSDVSAVSATSVYSDNDTEVSYNTANSTANAAPKTRFYGDLASAMRGVRLQESAPAKSMVGSVHNMVPEFVPGGRDNDQIIPVKRGLTRYSPGKTRPKRYMESVQGTVVKKDRAGEEDEENQAQDFAGDRPAGNGTRVVSRSGADVMDAGGDMGLGRSRRDVSGKIAEEGRGGWGSRLYMRKISGKA